VVGVGVDARGVHLKRRVVAGSVVDNEIEDHADASLVARLDKGLERGSGSEVDGGVVVVGDVIAVVGRRGEHGRQPERVDAEALDVRDAPLDLSERGRQRLAGERPDEHLVDRRRVGPLRRRVRVDDSGRAAPIVVALDLNRLRRAVPLGVRNRVDPEAVRDLVERDRKGVAVRE